MLLLDIQQLGIRRRMCHCCMLIERMTRAAKKDERRDIDYARIRYKKHRGKENVN